MIFGGVVGGGGFFIGRFIFIECIWIGIVMISMISSISIMLISGVVLMLIIMFGLLLFLFEGMFIFIICFC